MRTHSCSCSHTAITASRTFTCHHGKELKSQDVSSERYVYNQGAEFAQLRKLTSAGQVRHIAYGMWPKSQNSLKENQAMAK